MNAEASRPRLPALTSLRFFAAFHVLLFHVYAIAAPFGPSWFRRLSSIGYVGVSFFFVLSGFILVYTYAERPVKPRELAGALCASVSGVRTGAPVDDSVLRVCGSALQ